MSLAVPPDFGTPECAWAPDPAATPASVRATYLHHRVVLAARKYMGETATARDFASRLGFAEEKDVVRIRRKISGETPLSVVEMIAWSEAFQIVLSDVVGGRADDPEAYPSVYRAWIHTLDGRVVFRQRATVRWTEVWQHFGGLLVRELELSSTELLTSDVVRLFLCSALTHEGFDPDLVKVEAAGLRLLSADPVSIQVVAALDDTEASWQRILSALTRPTSAFVALALGQRTKARLTASMPGLIHTEPPASYDVPIALFEGAPADAPLEATWHVAAREIYGEIALLLLSRKTAS